MARLICIDNDSEKKKFIYDTKREIQSVNINFLIGAGCSFPALKPAGNIEKVINKKLEKQLDEEVDFLIFDFIKGILDQSLELIKITGKKIRLL